MNKRFFITFSLLLLMFNFALLSDEKKQADEDKLSEMLKQHKAYMNELIKEKEKALLEDEELRELQKKILELHTQLATKLEEKKQIRELHNKIIELEKDIQKEKEEIEKRKLLKD